MIKYLIKYLSVLGLLCGVCYGAEAAELDAVKAQTAHVSLAGYTNTEAINTSQDIQVIIRFEIQDKWHILSPEPGDIGLSTTVEWNLPSGYELIKEKWSLPQVFGEAPFVAYGYGRQAFYLATIRPSNEVWRKAELSAKVSWQACAEECVPEQALLKFEIPIVEHNVMPLPQWRKLADEAKQSFSVSAKNTAHNETSAEASIGMVMMMAFVGGLILNLMPCVFPVLSIKAMALMKHVQDTKLARREAILFFCGVMVSFMVMVSFLAWFRLSGESVGWGFQLQSPWFIFILLIIFIIITLMFLDIITVNVPLINKCSVYGSGYRLHAYSAGVYVLSGVYGVGRRLCPALYPYRIISAGHRAYFAQTRKMDGNTQALVCYSDDFDLYVVSLDLVHTSVCSLRQY